MASSLKFENMTSKVQIHSGSPALYQLKPEEENIGTLKRLTLGKKDPYKINRTILLVGETGSGKSTLVNALVNHAMGVEWEDDVWFQIVEEEEKGVKEEKKEDEKKSQSESQTSDVVVYEIFDFEGNTLPYSLTIIDTPGFGDTRGAERDARVSERLMELFRSDEGVQEITVVGLVLKASENQLSDRMRYILDSVVSLFGKNIEKNIVALITHSDGVTPKNALKALKAANIKCAEDEEGEPLHFLFNNHQSTQRTEKNMIPLKAAWDFTKEHMGEFTQFLKETEPQKLMKTLKVLKGRVKLTACIQNLQERVKLNELKQSEIQQTEEELKKHEGQMKRNEDFKIEVDEDYKVKERIDGGRWGLVFYDGAVCCTRCEENCHHPGCTKPWSPGGCKVMRGGRCTSCTGKCPVSDHVKENWKYVTKTRRVQKTKQELKEKYDQAAAARGNTTSLLVGLEKEREELQKDKDQWLEKSFDLVVKLEQISLNANALSTLVHLDFLIEKMMEKGDTEKVQKLREMRRPMDEGAKSGLLYYKNYRRRKSKESIIYFK